MAPPRTVMRQTDDSVASGLQHWISKERAYVDRLHSVELHLAQRLRFASKPANDPNPGATTTEFLAHLRQLADFHTLYMDKLQRLLDDPAPSVVESVLADLLLVTRIVYAQLHVHRARFKAAIDSQLRRKSEDAARILREFLQTNSLTSQQLVALPLRHLDDVLERADITVASPSLTALCDETKRFLDHAELESTQQQQLIELQSHLRGSPMEMELYNTKLLCRCEVALSSSTPSSRDAATIGMVLENEVDAAAKPLHVVYCLDDGTVLFIEKRRDDTNNDSGSPAATGLCINLKNDAVFIEHVPRSLRDAKRTTALVLSGPASSLQVTSTDTHVESFASCVTALLEQNETRTQQLRGGRTSEDLDLPHDLTALLKSPQRSPLVFPCFHDDPLPGIFWMRDATASAPAEWWFVELVQFGPFLLVFAISGWRKHRLVYRVDLTHASTTITETPQRGENWALVITTTEPHATTLELVSERRARIDFWYDQVAKAIDSATAERKTHEDEQKRQAAASDTASTVSAAASPDSDPVVAADSSAVDGATDARAKKRQRKATTPVNEETNKEVALQIETEEPPVKPTASKKKRAAASKASASASVAEAVAAAQQALEGMDDNREHSSTGTCASPVPVPKSTTKRQRTPPPVNTPKQRWVRRKTEDPDDAELETTQPGGGGERGEDGDTGSSATTIIEEPAREPDTVPNTSPEPEPLAIRIIFTGIDPTPKTFKKISAIAGAVYEDNIELATHVVAPRDTLKRTVKLLCGISCCDHILDERWLDESARVRSAVYERQYCLKDAKAEAKWGFDLRKTMYSTSREVRRQLFCGHRFFITAHKSVLPPVHDLVKIIEQAGGAVATSSGGIGKPQKSDLVITSETAMATTPVQKLLQAGADPERVYSTELVLSAILQQRLDLTQHRLNSRASASSSSSRSRNARR